MEELKERGDKEKVTVDPVYDDYELMAYSKLRIDFEYIVELLRGVVSTLISQLMTMTRAMFEAMIRSLKGFIEVQREAILR